MNRIKVVHVVPNAESSHFYNGLARWHDHSNFDISFYTLSGRGRLHDEVTAHPVHAFASDVPYQQGAWSCFLSLMRWLRQERPDVVHAHCFEAAVLGSMSARLTRRPVITITGHHVNGTALHFRRFGNRRAFFADTCANRWLATHVIAPTEDTRATLRHVERVPDRRIAVVPYGFELSDFRHDRTARTEARTALGCADTVVIGTVARLHWVKDLALLIRAFADVNQKLPGTRLVIVGEGPERQRLEGLIAHLRLHDAVTLTGHRYDVPTLLSAFDVFVNCSETECFNQALVEAMAAGLPVVATAVGAAPMLLQDAPQRLVEPGDLSGLATALQRLCADPAARRAAAGHSLAAVASCWTQEQMVRTYETLYGQWLRA